MVNKCSYPGCRCKEEAKNIQTLKLVNEEGALVELPFCDYHIYIVIGGHFEARIIPESQNLLGEKKEMSFEVIGPLKEVEIAEQVIGAREIIAQLKSDNKK